RDGPRAPHALPGEPAADRGVQRRPARQPPQGGAGRARRDVGGGPMTVVDKRVAEAEERMKKALEGVRREFAGIRSGKATPALLDTVRVEAYGQPVPLNQVGSVSAPEARLLVVQPWDKSLIKAITKAIQASELGLNPTDDG